METAEQAAGEAVTAKPEARFIATSATFPGYWGAHKDGGHHAIVECLRAGASRGGVFVVYAAYDGCGIDAMGSTTYLVEHGNPFEAPEGVYDASGSWLGENLADVAERCRTDSWFADEHPILSKDTIKALKAHKPE